MSASRERGEYVAWIEWKIPEAVEEAFGKEGGIVPLRVIREDPGSARVSLLVSERALRRFRSVLARFGGHAWLRPVGRVPGGRWDRWTTLTFARRDLRPSAFRLASY